MLINYNNKRFTKNFKAWIKTCYEKAEEILKINNFNLEVNIAFVSPKKIKELNSNFRNIDKVTDVLSFPQLDDIDINNLTKEKYPMDFNMESGNIMLGDIYICVKKVKSQSKEYQTTLQREMCYMAIHGLLHLLGYDHIDDEDKKVMRLKEEEILESLNIIRNK